MKQADARLIVGCLLAVVVPAATLHFSTSDERLAAGLTAAPFAYPRVLVAHLVTALPLGLILSGWIRALPAVKESKRGLWVALGIGSSGVIAVLSPGIGESIAASEFGPVPLLLLRSALAIVLVLPWCATAIDALKGAQPTGRPGVAFGVGLALAVIPCGLYAEAAAAARTKHLLDLLERERIVKAQASTIGLCEIGSEHPVGKHSLVEVRNALAARILKLRQEANRRLPASAPPAARIERAGILIQLDSLDDAAALLQPLTPADNTATLLLATVYRDQQRWRESDELYSIVLDKLLPLANSDNAARAACMTAFEGLVFNAREERRPADVERVLRQGLETLPSEAAYFHFHLGQHFADGGRPGLAIEHLRSAATLEPNRFGEPANNRIRQIRTHTPSCFLTPSFQ